VCVVCDSSVILRSIVFHYRVAFFLYSCKSGWAGEQCEMRDIPICEFILCCTLLTATAMFTFLPEGNSVFSLEDRFSINITNYVSLNMQNRIK